MKGKISTKWEKNVPTLAGESEGEKGLEGKGREERRGMKARREDETDKNDMKRRGLEGKGKQERRNEREARRRDG